MRRYLLLLITLICSSVAVNAQHHEHHKPAEKKVVKPGPQKKAASTSKKIPAKKPAVTKPKPKANTNHHGHDDQLSPIKDTVHQHMDMHNMRTTAHDTHIPTHPPPQYVGKEVRYDLYVTDTMVNYTGRRRHAYAINGTIPGPVMEFTRGDTAAIYVHNLAEDETSIHWHGVILPNQFDGVPYLTTQPIPSHGTHLYRFPVKQDGTYWYHSHSGLQEQAGLYGALIFHKPPTEKVHLISDKEGHKGEHDMHMNMQESKRGNHMQHSMNIAPRGDGSYNKDMAVVLSEWTDEKPMEVQRRLRTANDWYAIKKRSTQSYSEAIAAGHLGTKITNEWKRMNAMDVSDVYYDKFLINGSPVTDASEYKKGDRVRLRIINAGASSYFWVQYAGGKMTVIGNDGNDVVPVEVDRLIVGVSETYDVVVPIPEDMSYELRATPEDRTQAASLWMGSGMKMEAAVLPRLKYFEGMKMMNDMMKMNGEMKDMDMAMSLQQMDMNRVMYAELDEQGTVHHHHHSMDMDDSSEAENMIDMQGMNAVDPGGIVTLNYAMLGSPHNTTLPDAPYKTLEFELTGNMSRYVWSINDKVIREWDKILIEKGQNVRIILYNNSMMRHPMHLHGHDFRLLNGKGEYAPLMNVVDIMPMERDTIEFAGSEDGDWFFHCHILYHMMAGMGNVFSYKNSLPNPELPDKAAAFNKFLRNEHMWPFTVEVGLESNGSDGELTIPGMRYELRSEWRIGIKSEYGYESETYIGRYFGKRQWLYPFVGFDYHRNTRVNDAEVNLLGQLTNQNNRQAFVAGVEYTLPMLVNAQLRIDSKGKLRFQLSREDMPLTPRLRLNGMWNTDREYMAGLTYILRKWISLSTHYDSDMGIGAGIKLVY